MRIDSRQSFEDISSSIDLVLFRSAVSIGGQDRLEAVVGVRRVLGQQLRYSHQRHQRGGQSTR